MNCRADASCSTRRPRRLLVVWSIGLLVSIVLAGMRGRWQFAHLRRRLRCGQVLGAHHLRATRRRHHHHARRARRCRGPDLGCDRDRERLRAHPRARQPWREVLGSQSRWRARQWPDVQHSRARYGHRIDERRHLDRCGCISHLCRRCGRGRLDHSTTPVVSLIHSDTIFANGFDAS